MSSLPTSDRSDGSAERGEIIAHVFGMTDVGRTREHNEDAFAVADLATLDQTDFGEVQRRLADEHGALFVVADGMGGAAAGEVASTMAIEVIFSELRRRWHEAPRSDPASFAAALRGATEAANARIHAYAAEHPENRGMGTTATIAGLLGDTLYVSQVGDSRAYLVRDGVARQITKDQSLMQKLIEAGEITAEAAEHSDRRNIILQALGPDASIKIDLTHQRVRRGDVLVLCSDGLTGPVRDREIAAVVAQEPDLRVVCRRLIDLANANGGPDNITVVVARFEGEGLEIAASEDEVRHRTFPLDDDGPTQSIDRYDGRRAADPGPRGPLLADARPPRPRKRRVPTLVTISLGVAALLAVVAFAWQRLH